MILIFYYCSSSPRVSSVSVEHQMKIDMFEKHEEKRALVLYTDTS